MSTPNGKGDKRSSDRKSTDKGRDKRLEKRPDKIGEKRPDKLWDKSLIEDKRPEKPEIDKRSGYDKGFDFDYRDRFGRSPELHGDLERRVEALESTLGGLAPFIDSSLRPDLEGSGLSAEEDLARMRDEMEQQTQSDKRLLDSRTHRR